MLRLVLDTNILVAALRSSDGASAELVRLMRLGKFQFLATPALFLEYEEVLKRPEHLLAHKLSSGQVDVYLAALALLCHPVDLHFSWRPQLRDAADEMVLEAAVNGRANAIVTFNYKDFYPASETFGVEILRPAEIIRKIRS